jgi:polyphosphate kinase
VSIDLLIRGICCLRPGLPGISENIRVYSIVDRFLEHSRILVFGDGNKQQVFLSSADWMPRNFERRVEVMFPIESEDLRRRIVEDIIPTYLGDNAHTRILRADGTYARSAAGDGPAHRSQYELLDRAATRDREATEAARLPSLFETPMNSVDADGDALRERKKKNKKTLR